MNEMIAQRNLSPEEVQYITQIRTNWLGRSRKDHCSFVQFLWNLLHWTDYNEIRKRNVGIGWITDNEFFLEKLHFCKIMTIPINTLNFKLRTFKFAQSRQRQDKNTYWKSDLFTRRSTNEDLEKIAQRRQTNDDSQNLMNQASFLPMLESVRLYTRRPSEIPLFKCDVILLWQEIVGRLLWAIDRVEFIEAAAMRFCQSFKEVPPDDAFIYDAQQTEFAQYLRANNLDLMTTAKQMISYVLTNEKDDIVSMLDFGLFFARFGPDDCVLEKIHQLLCCSQTFGDWFNPGLQVFDMNKPMSGSYSNTFGNCFIIKRSQKRTYHVYNLANTSTHNGFMIDETGKKFLTWHAVFESLNVPNPTQGMGGGYDPDF